MANRTLRILSWVIAGSFVAFAFACVDSRDSRAPAHTGDSAPNVLLVVLDTVRADRVSSYGYSRPTTPELDRMGRDFIRFEEFYATSPWTIPSHASIFTGLYPVEHQATQEHHTLDERFTTLAEVLGRSGYETWAASGNPFMGPASNLAQGFDVFVEAWRGARLLRGDAAPHPVTASFERFLEGRDGSQPFFVFLNYMDAHEPFVPAVRDARRFLRRTVPVEDALRLGNRGWRKHWSEEPFSQEQLEVLSDLYDAGLAQLSREVARMIDGVKARGLYDDTVIVITSDHGEHFGENGAVGHFFSLYNTAVRVPLFIRIPGASSGRVEHRKGQLVDLFPTLLNLAGVDPGDFDHRGVDLLDSDARRSSVFAEYYYPVQVFELFSPEVQEREAARLAPHRRRQRAVQGFGYRLIWSSDGRHELYALAKDPGEQTNLLAEERLDPEAQAFLPLLERELAAYVKDRGGPEGLAPPEVLDPETMRALESLGYLEPKRSDEAAAER